MKAVTRLLREPLLHFVLLGAALFGVWSWRKDAGGGDAGRIVVTRAKISQLATGFERMKQRPPTPREAEALVQDFVREEVCVREARKMGLDRDDTMIRGRLREKFEFLTEDTLDATGPDDEARRKERREAFFRSLLARYEVVIEPAVEERKP
jgi:hypothetical protein